MIGLLLAASIAVHNLLRRWMPTNVIRDLGCTRQGLKWGVPTMLLAVPYFVIAYWLTTLLADGALGWLNLLVFVCIWSGIKMLWLGPISLVLLARARAHKFAAHRIRVKAERTERDFETLLPGARE
jgi:hypothetical protein